MGRPVVSSSVKWKYVSGSRWQPKSGCVSHQHAKTLLFVWTRSIMHAQYADGFQGCRGGMRTGGEGGRKESRVAGRKGCITSEKRKTAQSYWKGAARPRFGRNWNNNKAWTRNNEFPSPTSLRFLSLFFLSFLNRARGIMGRRNEIMEN